MIHRAIDLWSHALIAVRLPRSTGLSPDVKRRADHLQSGDQPGLAFIVGLLSTVSGVEQRRSSSAIRRCPVARLVWTALTMQRCVVTRT